MRKFFIATLVLLLLFSAGCAPRPNLPDAENTTPNTDESNTSTNNATADKTEDNTVEEPHFQEDVPLFVCQDRSDIEGDRNMIYFYNYKGDLLNSTDSLQTGFYAKNGLAPAYDSLTGLVGFADRNGVFVIEPQWYDAAAFSDDGVALVISKEENENGWANKRYGFINEKGEYIVPCIYDTATSFYPKGVAIVGLVENGVYKLGVIDKTGKILIEPKYKHIEHITREYILCFTENTQTKYDLSGNVIIEEDNCYVDETPTYDPNRPYITYQRVATTTSGYGYGVCVGEETVIPYQYDRIVQYGSFYVGIKYKDKEQTEQILDIYNEKFEKTAENLDYNFNLYRADPFGEKITLPDGYFEVYYYDDEIRESISGIIDSNGQIIVPLLYYRPIKLFTYEGAGGKFVY